MSQVKYKRIILKVSGEALAGEKGTGINPEVIKHLAEEIKSVTNSLTTNIRFCNLTHLN